MIITQRLEVEMLVSENRIRYEVAILQSLTSLNICVSALPAQLRKIIAVTAAIARNQRPVKRSICKVVSKRPA